MTKSLLYSVLLIILATKLAIAAPENNNSEWEQLLHHLKAKKEKIEEEFKRDIEYAHQLGKEAIEGLKIELEKAKSKLKSVNHELLLILINK